MANPVLSSPSVLATYRVETSAGNLEKLATQIAIGQTLGTSQPAILEQLDDYLAKVVSITPFPAPPKKGTDAGAFIQIAFPWLTIQSDFGTLLTVLFGKLSMGGKIRLTDVTIQGDASLFQNKGPAFGISGIRQHLGIFHRPLVMSIFKPCLGLSAETLGEMFYQQALGGVDWVKDDEILSDPELETAKRRLAACLKASEKAQQETGKKTLYAINLTGPAHQLLPRAQKLVKEGAQAFLFNYLSYGFPLLEALRQDPDIRIPIVAHPALAGAFYGSPSHGISPHVLFGQLPRLAGADMVLFPSPYGSVALPQLDAMAVAESLRDPTPIYPAAFPVPSAGITAEMLPQLMADFGKDTVINAGTGIHDHPSGSRQGAENFLNILESVFPPAEAMACP